MGTEPPASTPLALIPGFSLTSGMWDAVANHLPYPPMTAEIPGELDFPSTVAALGASEPTAYAGYSMGGRLALRIAIDHPQLVSGLALISTSPGIANPTERAQRRHDDELLADWIEHAGREAFLDRWLAQPLFAGLEPEAARAHRLGSAAEIADQLRRLGPGAHEPLWDRLGSVNGPVIVIAGERDERYVSIAARMVERIGSAARLAIVPNGGHALPLEQPEELARLIQQVL